WYMAGSFPSAQPSSRINGVVVFNSMPGYSVALLLLWTFAVQYRLDHQRSNRHFLEGDEEAGQDAIPLVDVVRPGRKPFQTLSPFFPGLHHPCPPSLEKRLPDPATGPTRALALSIPALSRSRG